MCLDFFVDIFLRSVTKMLRILKVLAGEQSNSVLTSKIPAPNSSINFSGFPVDIDSVKSNFDQTARGEK